MRYLSTYENVACLPGCERVYTNHPQTVKAVLQLPQSL